MSDEEDNDDVQFFKREEIVSEEQKGLAPVYDIFTGKRLDIKHDYRHLPIPVETEEEKIKRHGWEEFWNDPTWKKSF